MQAERLYERRRAAYQKRYEKQQQAAHRLSNSRLLTIAAGLILPIILYRAHNAQFGFALGAIALVLFVYLVIRHGKVRSRLRYADALRGINQKGIERAAGRWASFPDSGAEFRDDDHPYSSDLDLFGKASLFQWISSAQTELGRMALARFLTEPPRERAEIEARQAAVTELAGKLAWRQRFEAEGRLVREKLQPAAPLLAWAEESHPEYLKPWLKVGLRVLPAITVAITLLYLFGRLPWQAPVLLLVLQGIILRVNGTERGQLLTTVYRHEASLRTYAAMLERFEGRRFTAPWLTARQEMLRDAAGRPAFAQIRHLSRIVERISNRENAFFLILNIMTLWDYQCMVALEEWKQGSGRSLATWLRVLGEIEALSSLAHIRFDQPDWAMPAVVEPGRYGISAVQLGHPLITKGRVANDYEMTTPGRITVITGSNMSGKSTFLRTVGINLVLAYAGAPVCASQFRCAHMSLWTSMRLSDNLEQSISSFYAELLRIKRIVEAARVEKPVCFLLDEIFKGTNSQDRHQGAKALITQLEREGAFGLVSTHDLELGDLEQASEGRIRNYHFREEYQGGEIRFDYTLRPGVSTTRNALYLIRMVGIELDGDRDHVGSPFPQPQRP